MTRHRTPEEPAPAGEANVLPVMNIMFLLIPALLLAMEVASMASVAVSPPKFGSNAGDPSEVQDELDLAVRITAEGFVVTTGRTTETAGPPSIPLARPEAPTADYARYDYAALEQTAADYKRKYPNELSVRISAEGDVPAQVLVSTLDALRGTECSLATPGEGLPESCLFVRPVVEAGP